MVGRRYVNSFFIRLSETTQILRGYIVVTQGLTHNGQITVLSNGRGSKRYILLIQTYVQ